MDCALYQFFTAAFYPIIPQLLLEQLLLEQLLLEQLLLEQLLLEQLSEEQLLLEQLLLEQLSVEAFARVTKFIVLPDLGVYCISPAGFAGSTAFCTSVKLWRYSGSSQARMISCGVK